MTLSGVEMLRGTAVAGCLENLPGADARTKFGSPSAFATPVENPMEHR
jgi:hypothetical protein